MEFLVLLIKFLIKYLNLQDPNPQLISYLFHTYAVTHSFHIDSKEV